MDIKNILNDTDRRAATARPSLSPPAPTMPLATASAPYAYVPPAQQIVYTGPVYQLPPTVEVRHMGNTIHYRYASPYAFEEPTPQHVDYVYRDYPDHARPATRYSSPDRPPPVYPHQPEPRARIVSVEGGYEYRPAPSYTNSPTRDAHPQPQPPHQFPSDQRQSRRPVPRHVYARQSQMDSRLPPHPDMYPVAPHARYSARRAEPYVSYLPYPTPYSNIPQYASSEVEDYHASRLEREHQRISAMYDAPERHRRSKVHASHPEDSVSVERAFVPKNDVVEEHDVDDEQITPVLRKKSQIRKRERARMPPIREERQNIAQRLAVDNDSISDEPPSPGPVPLECRESSHTPPNTLERSSPRTQKDSEVDEPPPIKRKGSASHMSRKHRIMEATYKEQRQGEVTTRRKGPSRKSSFAKDEDVLHAQLYVDSTRSDRDKKKPEPPSRDDSITAAVTEEEEKDGNVADIGETSSGNDSEVEQIKEEGSVIGSEQELPLKRPRVRSREKVMRRKAIPIIDPKEPYPTLCTDFCGIPQEAIGDLLQLWEFVTAFAKSLRLSPFPLKHLEQALVHDDRSPLLDACMTRLVQMILTDSDLITELGITESVVRKLSAKNSKNQISAILDELPRILSFESDEVDDHFLHSTVRKLAKSSSKWAFYREIDAAAKLRVLRELIDYATMSDILRECITDSMDHAEEEKKRAREENSANRKKLELQLRELRNELLQFRTKNGLLDSIAESEGEKGAGSAGKEKSASTLNGDGSTEKEEGLTRQEKLQAAQKERKENAERRVKEREAEAMVGKIDKVRASLKMLKNIRLRNRTGSYGRESDIASNYIPSAQMPLRPRHEDPVRTYPIGTDRENRCYWFFQGCGRVWVEETGKGMWSALSNKEEVEKLLKWLSPSRREEQSLKKNIERRKDEIVAEMNMEAKMAEAAELEAQESEESGTENTGRTTRAGKRKANNEASKMKAAKAKKNKVTSSFLEYRNVEK